VTNKKHKNPEGHPDKDKMDSPLIVRAAPVQITGTLQSHRTPIVSKTKVKVNSTQNVLSLQNIPHVIIQKSPKRVRSASRESEELDHKRTVSEEDGVNELQSTPRLPSHQ
jgi:hypothetical protein